MTTASLAPAPRTLIDVIPVAGLRSRSIVRDVVYVIGFACLTAALAQISFRLSFTPVPITGQTFGVLLAGTTLGFRRGGASQLVYWVAGIFIPFAWYADDSTGPSVSEGWKVATGATAGYFFGFVVAAAVVGYLAERGQDRSWATSVPAMLTGTALIYLCGALWLAQDLGIPLADGDPNALALGVTPFLIGDFFKMLLAGLLAPAAWKALSHRSSP